MTDIKPSTIRTQRALNINFHQNINTLNPILASNRSEAFVASLTFNVFFKSDRSSKIIESYTYDSARNIHILKLYPDQTFHDGDPISTQHVKNLLQYLIAEHFHKPMVNQFFSSLEGFDVINWYREHKNIRDTIPSGFHIIDDLQFSLRLRDNNDKLFEYLQSTEFILFKKDDMTFIGNGEWKLTHLNEDISAELSRVDRDSSAIEIIHISFIKNQDLVIQEFFSGRLDLITYSPNHFTTTPATEKLNKLFTKKYPEYPFNKTNRSSLTICEINNVSDSIMLDAILSSIKSPLVPYAFVHDVNQGITQLTLENKKKNAMLPDSISFVIPVIQKTASRGLIESNDSTVVAYRITKNINLTDPHIVIEEMTVDNIKPGHIMQVLANVVNKRQEPDALQSKVILFLDQNYEYVIYNNSLKGINDYQDLAEQINHLEYKPIKSL